MIALNSRTASDPLLQTYLQEISRVKLLSAQGEQDLARRAAAGSRDAYEALVVSNLRFVVFVAKRYRRRGVSLMDLIAEGNVGLMQAIPKFDPDAGYRFTTYAYWWIRKSINEALRSQSRMVRIPAHMITRMASWAQAAEAWRQDVRREATSEELALQLSLSRRSARLVEHALETVERSCRAGALGGQRTGLTEAVPDARAEDPGEQVQHQEQLGTMHELVARLDRREREILRMRFGLDGREPRTLRSVGSELRLSFERVRQIERRVLDRLRSAMRSGQRDRAVCSK